MHEVSATADREARSQHIVNRRPLAFPESLLPTRFALAGLVVAAAACTTPAEHRAAEAGEGGTGDIDPAGGTNGSGGSDPDDTPADLDAVGPGCVQPADDAVPCEFDGLDDPVAWSTDPVTGLRYRRATLAEREANGWPASTYLVEAAPHVQAVEAGAPNLPPLPVPLSDDEVEVLEFGGSAVLEGPDHVTVEDGMATVGRPIFVRYLTAAAELPDALVQVTGTISRQRGFAGAGTVGGRRISVATYAPSWTIEPMEDGPAPADLARFEIYLLPDPVQDAIDTCVEGDCTDLCLAWAPAPCDGFVPDADAQGCNFEDEHPCVPAEPKPSLGACEDHADNDGDGTTDWDGGWTAKPDENCLHSEACHPAGGAAPQHDHLHEDGEQLMLTGTVSYCMRDADWESRMLAEIYTPVTSYFGSPTWYEAYDPQTSPGNFLRWVGSQCWLLSSFEAAEACKHDGACAPYDENSPHAYPFAGAGYQFAQYADAAWAAMAHAAQVGLKNPATLSGVVMDRVYPQDKEVGLGRYPWSGTPGAFVVGTRKSTAQIAMRQIVIAHEIGHAMGLEHSADNTNFMYESTSTSVTQKIDPEQAEHLRAVSADATWPRPYSYGND
ncbi:MAG: hypothetical protein D6705_02400 [Deltaproteobacteria bacterium]|nr:MAG: hypothetical protein D6705_02400 [Deltaproteobacteria bacterium]